MVLLEVQRAARKAGHGKPGFAYYCEMGLGKTLTALTEFVDLTKSLPEPEVTRMVVVCPNSFKGGWIDEIKKHGINVHPHVFESGADYANDQFAKTVFTKPPVLIINYEAIRKAENQAYIARFTNGKVCMIVLDEDRKSVV